jgi:hypothetical protein
VCGADTLLYKDTVVKDSDLGMTRRLLLYATGNTATSTATVTRSPDSQEINGTTGILGKCKRIVELGATYRQHQRKRKRKQFPC